MTTQTRDGGHRYGHILGCLGLVTCLVIQVAADNKAEQGSWVVQAEKAFQEQNYTLVGTIIEERITFLSSLPKSEIQSLQKNETASLLVLYGKLSLFNLWNRPKIDLTLAFAAFTLASSQGHWEAHYYLSIMYFFDMDSSNEKRWLTGQKKIESHWNLREHLETRNQRLSFMSLYSASLYGDHRTATAMANRYMKGLGVDRDCPTAIAYMKDKSYKVAIDDLFGAPNYLQNIYLDSEIFDLRLSNFAGNKHAKTNKEKHNLILMKSENGDAESSLQLAFTSYYGLHGQRVNMSQSFEYFYRAMLQGDQTAESFVGLMYYQGLGVDQNLKKAYDIFVAGEQKKNYNCFNGLGLMYLRGDYVQKDLTQAYKLFKIAADAGHMSAQFNFGSLILYDWSEEISSNTKLGFEYMTLAAQQGHIGAMYALAVAHLEGYEIFHSCMLSEKLFKAVLSRGPASRSSQLAYYHYTEGQLSTAAMYYLESAYNGYEVGMINAAVLFDKYSFLEEPGSVLSKFKENPILTKAGTLLEIDETGLLVEAFEDLLGVMSEDDTVSNTTTAIGEHLDLMIAKRLLEVAYTDKSTFATVRLGDYYYYGKAGLARNLSKALSYYTAAQKMNMSIDFQAQAFFSAGYMHQFGEGTPRNLTTARKHYEQASKIGGTVSYIGYIAKFFLEAEHLFRVDYPLLMQGEYFEAAKKFLSSFDPFDTEYTQGLVDSRIAVGLMALLILWTIRKRVSNQMKLVIKEHEAVESQV